MITREDVEEFTSGNKFWVIWKKTNGEYTFRSGVMSSEPARGSDADNRFLLEYPDEHDETTYRTVIIPNIAFVGLVEEEGPVLVSIDALDIRAAM